MQPGTGLDCPRRGVHCLLDVKGMLVEDSNHGSPVLVSFYLAHASGQKIDAKISLFKIDGIEKTVSDGDYIDLPARQGWSIVLGRFSKGRNLALEWEITVGTIGGESLNVTLAIFRDAQLSKPTFLYKGTY